jgi:hypothetical protein
MDLVESGSSRARSREESLGDEVRVARADEGVGFVFRAGDGESQWFVRCDADLPSFPCVNPQEIEVLEVRNSKRRRRDTRGSSSSSGGQASSSSAGLPAPSTPTTRFTEIVEVDDDDDDDDGGNSSSRRLPSSPPPLSARRARSGVIDLAAAEDDPDAPEVVGVRRTQPVWGSRAYLDARRAASFAASQARLQQYRRHGERARADMQRTIRENAEQRRQLDDMNRLLLDGVFLQHQQHANQRADLVSRTRRVFDMAFPLFLFLQGARGGAPVPMPNRGASDEMLSTIPTHVVPEKPGNGKGRAAAAGEEEEDCPICLESMDPGQEVSTLPCQHQYHTACINRWLRGNKVCSICRRPIDAKP